MPSQATPDQWRLLLRSLKEDKPPVDMALYVEPRRSSATRICREVKLDEVTNQKFLLVGARGGGKSTELRAIEQCLRNSSMLVATVDLDASGVSAATVSAFDLLYISALAVLRMAPDDELFKTLATAYGGAHADELGTLTTAMDGIAAFASATATLATLLSVTPTPLPLIVAGSSAAAVGLRLISKRPGVVAETSPLGRRLQAAARDVVRHVRNRHDHRHICVLLDGLEKINGESGERFRQVFEQTRLLADPEWTAVIAAPPCTLTETDAVAGRGYATDVVWGFGPDDLLRLRDLLGLRLTAVGLDPETDVDAGALDQAAEASGGLPRHAVQIIREAVLFLLQNAGTTLTTAAIDEGCRVVGEDLARGLTLEDLRLLETVRLRRALPGDERAATLFANGRILAHPPRGESRLTDFVVHPLLLRDVEGRATGDLA